MSDPNPTDAGIVTDADRGIRLTAMHRVYVETLPTAQREQLELRLRPEVRSMDRDSALTVLADPAIDRLVRWHLVATGLLRNPEVFATEPVLSRLVRVLSPSRDVPPNVHVLIAERLQAFAQQRPRPDDGKSAS